MALQNEFSYYTFAKANVYQIIFLVLIIQSESVLENVFSNFSPENHIGHLYIMLATKKYTELYLL